ncbi:hypothetical protein Hdeb2414_s0013g00413491 [Helianthus debilis subsp. tardiflorus]
MFRYGTATEMGTEAEVVSRVRRKCLEIGRRRRWDVDGGGKSNAAENGGRRWWEVDGRRRWWEDDGDGTTTFK